MYYHFREKSSIVYGDQKNQATTHLSPRDMKPGIAQANPAMLYLPMLDLVEHKETTH